MGMGMALLEDVPMQDGQFLHDNLDAYLIPAMADAPEQRVDVIEGILGRDSYPLGGIGELGIPTVAPAVANAIASAVGVRLRRLPIDSEQLKKA